ncbi:hypothetical protein Lser_V15G25543 [Lactuca serriola]
MERFLKRKLSISESDSDGDECEDLMSQDQSLANADDLKNDPLLLLKVSISAARYLLKCEIPFHVADESEMPFQSGMFLETVKLIRDTCENVREASLQNPEESNRVETLSMQKDIVTCYAQEILKPILEEIGDDVFTLIVDDYSDMSNEKLMSVVLRYVTCGIVKERFIGLIHMEETSALFLNSAIESLFAEYGLSLKKVRGVGYDGASNMRNVFRDLKALIMKENDSVYYVHCFAYQLQLVVVAVAQEHYGSGVLFDKIPIMKEVVGASCSRKNLERESQKEKLHEAIGYKEIEIESELDEDFPILKVVDACGGSHYTTLSRLVDLFSYVFDVLEYIEVEGRNNHSRYQAYSLLAYIDSFDFMFYLHLMLNILGIIDPLSQALEKKDQDILNTISLVKSTIRKLQEFRADGFDLLLKEISSFFEKHDMEMLNMEEDYVIRRQKINITLRQHYEFNCFNIVVDMQIQALHDCFNDASCELLTCISALNPCESFCDFDTSKLMRLAEMYPYDFTCEERVTLKLQLDLYIDNVQHDERFANLNGISDLAKMIVETRKHLTFPLVYRLLKLALVLPVATPSVERCVSAKETVKSYLSNQICDDFVRTCVIPVVEKKALCNVTNEDVINRLQKMETHGEQL